MQPKMIAIGGSIVARRRASRGHRTIRRSMALALKADHFRNGSMLSKKGLEEPSEQ
jgi:hypothetical protein